MKGVVFRPAWIQIWWWAWQGAQHRGDGGHPSGSCSEAPQLSLPYVSGASRGDDPPLEPRVHAWGASACGPLQGTPGFPPHPGAQNPAVQSQMFWGLLFPARVLQGGDPGVGLGLLANQR